MALVDAIRQQIPPATMAPPTLGIKELTDSEVLKVVDSAVRQSDDACCRLNKVLDTIDDAERTT